MLSGSSLRRSGVHKTNLTLPGSWVWIGGRACCPGRGEEGSEPTLRVVFSSKKRPEDHSSIPSLTPRDRPAAGGGTGPALFAMGPFRLLDGVQIRYRLPAHPAQAAHGRGVPIVFAAWPPSTPPPPCPPTAPDNPIEGPVAAGRARPLLFLYLCHLPCPLRLGPGQSW